MLRTKWASEGASLRARRPRQQRLSVVLTDLDQCLFEPLQVSSRQRLVRPETMYHDVVKMILQILLHLLLILNPGHLRQAVGGVLPHGDNLALKVGVNNLARLPVQEGHQATQTHAQFLKTVQADAFPEAVLLHLSQVGELRRHCGNRGLFFESRGHHEDGVLHVMGVGGSLVRVPRLAHRFDEGEHLVAHRLEHLLRRKLLETRPTQSILVGGEHRLFDRVAGTGSLTLLARVQLVQPLDEEQVSELLDNRERIRDAAGPHGVPDSVDLGLQLTGDHDQEFRPCLTAADFVVAAAREDLV